MKTYLDQMREQRADLRHEIVALERFKNEALLTEEQLKLLEEQIEITKILKAVITRRIDYDIEHLRTIRGNQ